MTKFISKHIAVSRQVKNYHRRKFGIPSSKIDLVPNGLNLDGLLETGARDYTRNSLGYGEKDYIFLNVASFNGIKCHHLMLTALKNIIKTYPDVKLLCVGNVLDKGLYVDICDRIAAEGLEENVKIIDFLDRKHLKDIYQIADCFILPSLQEGWSIAAMEAMYFNLPLILTDIGSARDIVKDNDIGIIIANPYEDIVALSADDIMDLSRERAPKNSADLERAMCTFLENRELWKEKGSAGRHKVLNDFSVEKMAKRYVALITDTFYIYRKNIR